VGDGFLFCVRLLLSNCYVHTGWCTTCRERVMIPLLGGFRRIGGWRDAFVMYLSSFECVVCHHLGLALLSNGNVCVCIFNKIVIRFAFC
jgi:hypothetical protein